MHLFDTGWNALRDQIFANQKKLGVIPQDAKLTAWPDNLLKTWDTLSADEKKMFIRQGDVYAAYLMYTDHEIGRVVQAVEDLGRLDNTLIIFVSGGNGASAEGKVNGTISEGLAMNGVDMPASEQLKWYDAWGTDQTFPLYAVGWAWAFDTPYKWTKQIASFFGGTRNGMVISWPARIKDKGGIRKQFHHVIDIVPTILEATGIPHRPWLTASRKSRSRASVWSTASTRQMPRRRRRTTLSTSRCWAIMGYTMTAGCPPWQIVGTAIQDPATAYKMELYDVRHDWTQYTDVAAANPKKVKQMTDLMFGEFAKYQVLPLDASVMTRWVSVDTPFKWTKQVASYFGGTKNGMVISWPGHINDPGGIRTSYRRSSKLAGSWNRKWWMV